MTPFCLVAPAVADAFDSCPAAAAAAAAAPPPAHCCCYLCCLCSNQHVIPLCFVAPTVADVFDSCPFAWLLLLFLLITAAVAVVGAKVDTGTQCTLLLQLLRSSSAASVVSVPATADAPAMTA